MQEPEFDLPEMEPGETRQEWAERIRALFAQQPSTSPPDAKPYNPEEWNDVRAPYREAD